MHNYLKREMRFAKPQIAGVDNLSNTIAKHFKFVNRRYFDEIYIFIQKVSELHSFDYNKIEIITGIRFRIGEIEYYAKRGNLLLTIPDDLIEGVKSILEKHFPYFHIEKQWEGDESSVITIDLNV